MKFLIAAIGPATAVLLMLLALAQCVSEGSKPSETQQSTYWLKSDKLN